MKRIGNIYNRIHDIENLRLADKQAQKGKSKTREVIKHNLNQESNLLTIQKMLEDKTFQTSEYTTFLIHEPKTRTVFKLPYFPDRIVQHAIVNIAKPVFLSHFTNDTYSCIEGKGVHAAARNLRAILRDLDGTTFCLKLDIQKFYPSVNHGILKSLLRRKFKDNDFLKLVDDIIDSAPGLPIGNYLSQYLANYYLSFFDHWVKEILGVKYYFRYADDIVILSDNKEHLHSLLAEIHQYLLGKLDLIVKSNYQVFPVAARGIDFLGYKFFHTHTLLRKSIKKRFARMVSRSSNQKSIAAYWGWAKHCNSRHFIKKLSKNRKSIINN